jgi:hydrogenase nickel incorporation protein HypA/HybF
VHELSVCQAIADIVIRRADGRRVAVIHVRAGQLRQIVPDTLVFCWGLLTEDTPLAGAELDVEQVPARIACRACGAEALIGDLPVFACAACGSTNVEITSGEEFLITSLDLAEEVPP